MTKVLSFSKAALREIDRRAVEAFHLPILVLMENAGRAVAMEVLHLLGNTGERHALLLAGPGNNGGDGFAAARHLHNAGVNVAVLLLVARDRYKDAAATNLAIIEAMHIPVSPLSADHAELRDYLVDAPPEALLIDGLFGTGLSRAPEALAADVIRAANASRRKMVAIDVPSGLDADSGEPVGDPGGVIRAAATVSFNGTKDGFTRARQYTGNVVTADIGAPRELLETLASK